MRFWVAAFGSLLMIGACASLRPAYERPAPLTYEELARRCGYSVMRLDSLLATSTIRLRNTRGIEMSPPVLGAILGTVIPADVNSPDCEAQTEFIVRTVLR